MKCPNCRREVKDVQRSCLCGWQRPPSVEEERERNAARLRAEEERLDRERLARWKARGSETVEQARARIKELTSTPRMSNYERACLILAQDTPALPALEWAREYVEKHKPKSLDVK